MRKLYLKGLLASLLLLISANVSAYDIEVDGVYYNIDLPNLTAAITFGEKEYMGDFVTPDSFVYRGRTFTVTSIGEYAFKNCSALTSVTITNNITTIEVEVFDGCSGLTSLTIPASITELHSELFLDCTSLENITIEDSDLGLYFGTTSYLDGKDSALKTNPLRRCPIKNLHLGRDCNYIAVNAPHQRSLYNLFNNSTLTSLTIGNKVKLIRGEMFNNCTNLDSLRIEDGSEELQIGLNNSQDERSLFKTIKHLYVGRDYWCYWYDRHDGYSSPKYNVKFPNNLESVTIGGTFGEKSEISAFRDCGSLKSVTILNWEEIEEKLFYRCTGLASVELPDNLKNIGESAFYGCTGLTSINFPELLQSIGSRAFSGCSGLKSLTLPNSLKSMGEYAFSGCSLLTSIAIPDGISSIDGCFSGCIGLTSIKFPKELYFIGKDAFKGCVGLTTLDFPKSLEVVEESAFEGCSRLTSLNFPGNFYRIGRSAFSGCTRLTSLILPDYLSAIEESAFKDCKKLSSIRIPKNIWQLSESTFSGCSALTQIYLLNPYPCKLDDKAFDNTHYLDATVFVPQESLSAYIAADGWKNFFNIEEYDPTGINDIESDVIPMGIYTIDGKKVLTPRKGQMYIFRDGNGKAVKKIAK